MGELDKQIDIDERILQCCKEDWKSVPQIADELEENKVRIYKRVKQIVKRGLIVSVLSSDRKRKPPLMYKISKSISLVSLY